MPHTDVPLILAGLVGASGLVMDEVGNMLRTSLHQRRRHAWSTACRYQLTHAAALTAVACMLHLVQNAIARTYLTRGYYIVLAGALGFAGSIYAMCLDAPAFIGPITPLSGLVLIMGWEQKAMAPMLGGKPSANYGLLAAALSGGVGVILGALGSHALYNYMDAEELRIYGVANQSHLMHSIVLMSLATAATRASRAVAPHLRRAYAFMASGMLLSCGARYVLCVRHKPQTLVYVAHAGTSLLLAGWMCIAIAGCTAAS